MIFTILVNFRLNSQENSPLVPAQGERPSHLRSASGTRSFGIVLGCLMTLVCGGCTVNAAPRPVADRPYLIRLTGEGMAWHVRYAGSDGYLDTVDDVLLEKDLHLPAERSVRILLTSRDLLYTLAIPRHRIHEIAVPDVEFALELPADRPGEYRFQGDQMCGFQHEVLFGRVFVHRPSEFELWLKRAPRS